ncbi:MAG: response regulator [Patescibacteria group bacterium]
MDKSVLIIEDSPYLAESLADMLAIRGISSTIAPNGREGVTLALTQHPDLILLDIRLPDIDGYEVYRQLRADAWGKTAKIIILTASESTDTISKNIDLPSAFVLYKPDWSVPKLLARIEEVLRD